MAHKWADWLHSPCHLGGPQRFRAWRQNHKWPSSGQIGYITPTVWGSPTLQSRGQNQQWPTSRQISHIIFAMWRVHLRFRVGGNISSGLEVGRLATSPLPFGGAPTLQSGGQNQQWPTKRQIGYITPAMRGVSNASEWGTKSTVAQKWADWQHHHSHVGGPQHLRAGDRINSGPQVGKLAT